MTRFHVLHPDTLIRTTRGSHTTRKSEFIQCAAFFGVMAVIMMVWGYCA